MEKVAFQGRAVHYLFSLILEWPAITISLRQFWLGDWMPCFLRRLPHTTTSIVHKLLSYLQRPTFPSFMESCTNQDSLLQAAADFTWLYILSVLVSCQKIREQARWRSVNLWHKWCLRTSLVRASLLLCLLSTRGCPKHCYFVGHRSSTTPELFF